VNEEDGEGGCVLQPPLGFVSSDSKDPDRGSLMEKTVHPSWEAPSLIRDNDHLYGALCCKIVPELGSLFYLLDASTSPREVQQWEETGSEPTW